MKSIQVEIDEFVEENDLYTQGYSSVFSDKDGKPAKVMVKVNGELDVERQYFVNNTYNRLKFVDNEWHFLRFDDITYDHNPYYSNSEVNWIYTNIVSKLDYELKYAEDRGNLVEELINENEWIFDLVSDTRIIAKEHKKKNSFLAIDQKPDKTLALITSYLEKPKYINLAHELSEKSEDEDYKKLLKDNKLTEDDINYFATKVEDWNKYSIREDIEKRGKASAYKGKDSRVEWFGHIDQIEEDPHVAKTLTSSEESKHREQKKRKTFNFNKPDTAYWNHFFSDTRKTLIPFFDSDMHNEDRNKSVLAKSFREETYNTLSDTVDMFQVKLGYLKKEGKKLVSTDAQERKAHQEKLIKEIGRKQYSLIKRTYNELKYDLTKTRDSLTGVFDLKGDHSTVYKMNEDTWYEDEEGNIVELSKNRVRLDDPATYRGILLEYKNLKKKYKDKFTSDFWSLLNVFEEVFNKTNLTVEEKFVTDLLINEYSQTEIRKQIEQNESFKNMTTKRLSVMLNKVIPNKLANTYLDSVDEWIYTYNLKGKYKTCSKCNEVKLISNDRYFNREPKGRDGFKNNCKSCSKK